MLLLVKQAGSWPCFARGFPRVALGNSAGSRRCCVTSPGSRVGITELFDAGSALRWKRRYAAGSATLRRLQSLWFFRRFVSAGLKARVQRTVRVVLARVKERVARTGRESRSTRERVAHWRVVLNSPIWTPPTGSWSNQSVRMGRSPAHVHGFWWFWLALSDISFIPWTIYTGLYICCNIHYDAKV